MKHFICCSFKITASWSWSSYMIAAHFMKYTESDPSPKVLSSPTQQLFIIYALYMHSDSSTSDWRGPFTCNSKPLNGTSFTIQIPPVKLAFHIFVVSIFSSWISIDVSSHFSPPPRSYASVYVPDAFSSSHYVSKSLCYIHCHWQRILNTIFYLPVNRIAVLFRST
jgi:hypothetical protein